MSFMFSKHQFQVKATGQEKKDDMTIDLLSLEQGDQQLVEYVKNNLLIKTGSSNGKVGLNYH